MIERIAILTIVACWAPLVAVAREPASDFERARTLRDRVANTVFRDTVKAHWLRGNTRFWYRVSTGPQAHEFVLVDAAAGRRELAFDHVRLAQALAAAGEKDVRANRLDLDRLTFDDQATHALFAHGAKNWRFRLPAGPLERLTGEAMPTNRLAPLKEVPRATARTGAEVQLTFENRTPEPVDLVWLTLEGKQRGYGRLAPGAKREQHTFAGHAWLVIGPGDETLAAFEAPDEPATAEISDASKPLPAQGDRRRDDAQPGKLSPDGKWRVFVKEHDVWLSDTAGGQPRRLTDDGRPENPYTDELSWSPDSRKLVALRIEGVPRRVVTLVESSPTDQLQPKVSTYDYFKPGDRLPHPRFKLFDLASGKALAVSEEPWPNPYTETGHIPIRWKPDSSEFTFDYNQRGHQAFRVIAVDAKSGAARVVVDEHCPTFFCYSSKHEEHWIEPTDELIWMSERDGWNHLWLYDSASGRVKNQITRGEWAVRDVERVDAEARQVWFTAGGIRPGQDPYFVHHCRVNFDGTGLVVLTEGNGTHEIEWSPDRRFFIDRWSRVDLAPVSELRRADGSLVCELERGDAQELLATGWRPPEAFVAKGRDGQTDIYGVIYRPQQFDPSKRCPVIEYIYAGPHGAFVPKAFNQVPGGWVREMAELGFIVVQCDGMGTNFRSKSFHDVCWQNLGDSGFPDRIAWLRAAAAKYPQLDLSRVGIYGGSAGGQSSTRALLAHGDFYKVAVSDCGCHDNRMDKIWWNEQWMGWPVGPHYAEQSNVTQAKRLTGKLMLIVGELDRNVDPSTTMQVAKALVDADKDFDLLVIPGQGHGAAETPYGTRRRAQFFVRHLLGEELK